MSASKKLRYSTIDGLPVRESGPWIGTKHYYLRRYADIVTRGMKKKWPQLTYVDLFAGPGRCWIREQNIEVDGSALIALNYGFSKYIFVESNAKHFRALKTRCKDSPKFSSIRFIKGDCNLLINKVVPEGLTLAFIDPTGIDIWYNTIQRLVEGRHVDLLMTIHDGIDIKRNLGRYMKVGSTSKLHKFLCPESSGMKFGSAREVVMFYKRCIGKLGFKTVELKDVPVKTAKTNVQMYFLMFASRHPRALEFWKKVGSKDPMGQLELF